MAPSTNFAGYLNEGSNVVAGSMPAAASASASEGSWDNWGSYEQGWAPQPPQFPPSAPAGPREPSASGPASSGGRAAAPLPEISMSSTTLGPLMGSGCPLGFAELVWTAGADHNSDTEAFLAVPEDDFKGMIDLLSIDEVPLSAMQRGAVIRYLQKIMEAFGLEPPSFGTATKRRRPQEATTIQSSSSPPSARSPRGNGQLIPSS